MLAKQNINKNSFFRKVVAIFELLSFVAGTRVVNCSEFSYSGLNWPNSFSKVVQSMVFLSSVGLQTIHELPDD